MGAGACGAVATGTRSSGNIGGCYRLSCRRRIGDGRLARRDPRGTFQRAGEGGGRGSRAGVAGGKIPRRSSPPALPEPLQPGLKCPQS